MDTVKPSKDWGDSAFNHTADKSIPIVVLCNNRFIPHPTGNWVHERRLQMMGSVGVASGHVFVGVDKEHTAGHIYLTVRDEYVHFLVMLVTRFGTCYLQHYGSAENM
jgi:hypothetical protein